MAGTLTSASPFSTDAAPTSAPSSRRPDLLIGALLFAIGAWSAWHFMQALDPAIYRKFSNNFWFQSDLQRVVSNMLDTGISHYRTNVHPIYSLVVHPLVWLLSKVWPGTDLETVQRFQAGVAGLWALSLYALWRLMRFSRAEAAVFVLFGLSCSAAIYWFAIPETYGLGSLSLIQVLIVAAWGATRAVSDRLLVISSAASLSITITNWMGGLALTVVKRPLKDAVRLGIRVLVIMAVLAVVQKIFFPTASLFFLGSREELSYINHKDGGTVLDKLAVLLAHLVVMPQQATLPAPNAPYWMQTSVQHAALGSGGPWSLPALVAWIALLAAGIWGAVRSFAQQADVLKVLGLVLAGQVGLHLLYGDETFLYSLHVLPLLLTVAIFATRSPLKSGALLLAAVALGLTLANNLQAFAKTQDMIAASLTQREQVQQAMRLRPDEIWPRGVGHVVLAQPGSPLQAKAYHEPGASFSPAPGSFGLSVRVTDADGKLVAAGETIPLDKIQQQWAPADGPAAIELKTRTPYYAATWRQTDAGWQLRLHGQVAAGQRLWLVLRSVGPAGGPVRHLQWDGRQLQVNDRWRVTPERVLAQPVIGNETAGGVKLAAAGTPPQEDPRGWLYAAMEVPADGEVGVTVAANAPPSAASPFAPASGATAGGMPPPRAWLLPQTPDSAFDQALFAQQAHLLQGLTDNETRPGEPVNYDFEWSRDGAFIVVALARSGHLDAAATLLKRYATEDFFGGFGAEADAPGLALWAMDQVAGAREDAALRRELWPHVLRKARFIASCIKATEPVLAEASGRVLAKARGDIESRRPCLAAREGLIMGRMDNQYPLPYVNAVSYMGLKIAARWASTQSDTQAEREFASLAQGLGDAWKRFYLKPRRDRFFEAAKRIPAGIPSILKDQRAGSKQQLGLFKGWVTSPDDARTYIVGLWPSWVAAHDAQLASAYGQVLEGRWQRDRTADGGFRIAPSSTYFDVAEAHQWLLGGKPERAWVTLNWFLKHSRSPGLYTWWEGSEEENSSALWENARGWVTPDGVSPHYWTAAEFALLQLDMLAYVDESSVQRPLVIGAGVPAKWLEREIRSGRLYTARGPVSWTWKDGELRLQAPADVTVKLAPVFARARLVRE